MFKKWQQKWKVTGFQLALIFITFGLGGSLCARAGNWVLGFILSEKSLLYWIIYVPLVGLLWPLCVLLISIPLGQFGFFKNYVRKIGSRFKVESLKLKVGEYDGERGAVSSGQLAGRSWQDTEINLQPVPIDIGSNRKSKINLAIFASGAGSNAQRIIEHFSSSPNISVALIVCNKPGAGVLKIASENKIPALLIEKGPFIESGVYIGQLKDSGIDYIILAGFLWKLPHGLVQAYPKKIINIHPALLPAHGGKGMYGHFVHEAVIANKEKQSGITIHYVDEWYDHGEIIFQAACAVDDDDTPDTLAAKIHILEHNHYPGVIEKLIRSAVNC
jgi:formyltetrahydrofolate-dependent phosphoribosylglycinamide formyltransferase